MCVCVCVRIIYKYKNISMKKNTLDFCLTIFALKIITH